MQILDKDVSEFQALYKAKFGKELDSQTARHKLTMLVRQMEIVHQPITKQQLEELARRDSVQADAKAMAELIYDIYQDKKEQDGKAK